MFGAVLEIMQKKNFPSPPDTWVYTHDPFAKVKKCTHDSPANLKFSSIQSSYRRKHTCAVCSLYSKALFSFWSKATSAFCLRFESREKFSIYESTLNSKLIVFNWWCEIKANCTIFRNICRIQVPTLQEFQLKYDLILPEKTKSKNFILPQGNQNSFKEK